MIQDRSPSSKRSRRDDAPTHLQSTSAHSFPPRLEIPSGHQTTTHRIPATPLTSTTLLCAMKVTSNVQFSTHAFPAQAWLGFGVNMTTVRSPSDMAAVAKATLKHRRLVEINLPHTHQVIDGVSYAVPSNCSIALASGEGLSSTLYSHLRLKNRPPPDDSPRSTSVIVQLVDFAASICKDTLRAHLAKLQPFDATNESVISAYHAFFKTVGSHVVTGCTYASPASLQDAPALTLMDIWTALSTSPDCALRERSADMQRAFASLARRTHRTPCRLVINTDWAELVLLSPGARIVPGAGAPPDTSFSATTVKCGVELSYNFLQNRVVDFDILNDGTPVNVQMSRGFDGTDKGNHNGRCSVNIFGHQYDHDKYQDNAWNTASFYQCAVNPVADG
ncbi:hypothetical protein BV25DRAFT_1138446 [Artomyces pyxidatus]|uniref:Uncharacterized protein n=1 Tax=Artomyces pyxidatus TaxID=48021 RepID=A0ACB8SU08_9AGAM|nr:hypothetical protein BV25DRAFT_1138446 [Artomyces pyxidatus]